MSNVPRAPSTLRLLAPPSSQASASLQLRVRERRHAYEQVLGALSSRVQAAHLLMRERGDVLPPCLPRDRGLEPWEIDELAWRVYSLTVAMRLSFARCHPTLVRLAAEWWGADDEVAGAWEAFVCAHWT